MLWSGLRCWRFLGDFMFFFFLFFFLIFGGMGIASSYTVFKRGRVGFCGLGG